MEMNIDPDWILRMAEQEDDGIISAGGLVTRIAAMEPKQDLPQIKSGYLVGHYLEGKYQIAVVQAVKCDRVIAEGGELLIADLVPPF